MIVLAIAREYQIMSSKMTSNATSVIRIVIIITIEPSKLLT